MQRHETEQFLRFVHAGHRFEIRAFVSRQSSSGRVEDHSFSGVFDNPALAARAAQIIEHKYAPDAVYYSLNAIRPEIPAELNKLQVDPRYAIRDRDILARTTYLIDCDPIRESDTASNDQEHEAAIATARKIATFLGKSGWPEPIVLDSGNGCHLLYGGDRCNPDSDAWKFVLRGLANRFDSEQVHIDTSVWNPSRISRLPGMMNRKGEATASRPHRVAHVIQYPATWVQLPHVSIYQLASSWGFDQASASTAASDDRELLIDEAGVHQLIDEFPELLDLRDTQEKDGATYFYLRSCPFAGRAHRGDPRKTALILSEDRFGFRCMSGDCSDHGIGDLLRLLYEETGRRPSMMIWSDVEITENDIEKWGGIEDLNISQHDENMDGDPGREQEFEAMIEALEAEAEARLKATPEWQHDAELWARDPEHCADVKNKETIMGMIPADLIEGSDAPLTYSA